MMQQTVAALLHIFKGIFGELLFKLHTGILFCVILLDPDTMGLIPILGMIPVFNFTSHFLFFFFLLLFSVSHRVLNSRLQLPLKTAIASRKDNRYGIQPVKAGYNPLNAGYSPLNTVTVTLPLNVLAGDLKPWSGVRKKHCWLAGSRRLLLEQCERKTLLAAAGAEQVNSVIEWQPASLGPISRKLDWARSIRSVCPSGE